MSARTSGKDRQRALLRQERGVFVSADRPSRCPITFTATISGGGRVKSQAQQLLKPVICRFRRFATGQKFTKSLLFCSRPFLQQSVPFCKSPTKKYTDILYYISTTKSSKETHFFDKFDKE